MATVKTNIQVTGVRERRTALRRTVRALTKGPRRSVNRQRRRVRERHRVEAQDRALHLWARCMFGNDVAMGMDVGRPFSESVGVLVQARSGRRGMSSTTGSTWNELRALLQRGAFAWPDDTLFMVDSQGTRVKVPRPALRFEPVEALPGPAWTAAEEMELRRAIVGDGASGEPAAGSRAVAEVHAVVVFGAKGAIER